ncbi:MAG: nucleotide exchange factor GrpE [Defluviitaleaceae bacterium]|nr:nucleotide exchange factor GrpE [Defluviitaleaceae bacterium]
MFGKENENMDEAIVGEIMNDLEIEDIPAEAYHDDVGESDLELAALKELNALYHDKIKQQAAEFENYRNRTTKEMGRAFDKGVQEMAASLLPIIDNFERALKNADKKDPFAAGMLMIQNQLHTAFENMDIKKIPTVGEKFDTNYHSAVSHIEDANFGEGIVAQELQGGYIYKGNVIRHAVVVVAN